HMCNNAFTGLLLDIARDPYPALDIPLRVREFPFALLVAILALVFVGTHLLHAKKWRAEGG
ncbi:MAG: hypothetical protein ACHQT8_05770, partial [Chlamydiales bacterium]